MARTKNEVLTIRTTAEIKTLLKLAADRERRSVTSMIEILVMDYASAHDLLGGTETRDSTRKPS